VTFSIPTLDEEVWRRTEPGTAHPRQRLKAIAKLIEAGIKASVGMAPILPGLSDRPEQIDAVVRAARDAGAVSIWANLLYLRPGTKEHFMDCLARHWPDLLPRYLEEYSKGAYLPEEKTRPVQQLVASLRQEHGIADRRAVKSTPAERPRQLELISA